MIASVRSLAAAAFVAGIVTTSPLLAEPAASRTLVRYGDLDLTSQSGAAALQARVTRAVRYVCGSADIRDLPAQRDIGTCRVAAQEGARPQVELALAAARSGQVFAENQVRVSAPGF
jgi:UrcA family protein